MKYKNAKDTPRAHANGIASISTSRINKSRKAALERFYKNLLDKMRNYIRAEQIKWHYKVKMKPVKLKNGDVSSGLLMRRKVDGEWEYRHPTDKEVEDYENIDAW